MKSVRQRLLTLASEDKVTEDLTKGLKLLEEVCLLETGRLQIRVSFSCACVWYLLHAEGE